MRFYSVSALLVTAFVTLSGCSGDSDNEGNPKPPSPTLQSEDIDKVMTVLNHLNKVGVENQAVSRYVDFSNWKSGELSLGMPSCEEGSFNLDQQLSGEDDSIFANDQIVVAYNNCDYNGVIANGGFTLNFTNSIEDITDLFGLEVELGVAVQFSNLSLATNDNNLTNLDGDLTTSLRLDATDARYTLESSSSQLRAELLGNNLTISDFRVVYDFDVDFGFDTQITFEMDAIVESSLIEDQIVVQTVEPIRYDPVFNEMEGGEVYVTAFDGSNMTITFQDESSVTVELDQDGDGSADFTSTDLQWDFIQQAIF